MLSTSKPINSTVSVTRKAALIGAAVALCALSASTQTAKDVKRATPPQNATDSCKPTHVIPLISSEPPAKIIIDPPLAEPLASRGVAIIEYCAPNLHIAPVFGPGATSASPRVGHIHVSLDNAAWVWADASGNPIILQGLSPGPHTVTITLVDANHHPLDKGSIAFVIPAV